MQLRRFLKVNGLKEEIVNWEVISPENDNCFFGYYDLSAFDCSGDTHLCCRTDFIDRIPTDQDKLELGYVKNHTFTGFAETIA